MEGPADVNPSVSFSCFSLPTVVRRHTVALVSWAGVDNVTRSRPCCSLSLASPLTSHVHTHSTHSTLTTTGSREDHLCFCVGHHSSPTHLAHRRGFSWLQSPHLTARYRQIQHTAPFNARNFYKSNSSLQTMIC